MDKKKLKFDKLIEYLEGELDPDERRTLQKRIDEDPVLRKMLAVIEQMKSEPRETEWDRMQKPSHEMLDRLLGDIGRQKEHSDQKYGVNIFDSGLLPIPDGIRPAEVETRRLKYLVEFGELEISLYPVSPKSFELIGQISGVDRNKSLSVILESGKTKISVNTNEFHLFRFPKIASGKYRLTVIEGKNEIGLVDIDI